jgi:hypothetical protein
VATTTGTAVAGVNYTPINQVLSFAAGQTSQTVTVPVSNTGAIATPLTVSIALSQPGSNATLGSQSTATLVIQSVNQAPPPPPLVTMQSVQLVTKKHLVSEILIGFSGAVNATEATSTAIYELIAANKAGLFLPTKKNLIKIRSAAYSASGDLVTLKLKTPVRVKKTLELVVNGVAPNGLQDSAGRLIDGNHDGVAGGNAVATITKPGVVKIDAVPGGPLAAKRSLARVK